MNKIETDKIDVEIIVKYDGKKVNVDITDATYDMVYEDVDLHFENLTESESINDWA